MASGISVQAMTIARAAAGLRSPAAIGRNGLLTRSISTSVTWLTPTIATLTVRAATNVASRSGSPGAAPGWDAAIAYSPTTDSAVPMIVCGRAKRHRTTIGFAVAETAAVVTRPRSGGGAGRRARHGAARRGARHGAARRPSRRAPLRAAGAQGER